MTLTRAVFVPFSDSTPCEPSTAHQRDPAPYRRDVAR